MTKKIKFRIWDRNKKQMLYYPKNRTFTLNDLYFADEDTRYVFMQSTGLFDKKGVEIYEGDTVKTNNDNIVKVSYSNYFGAFHFGGFPTNQEEIQRLEIEIIGNIYQNPELLNKQYA